MEESRSRYKAIIDGRQYIIISSKSDQHMDAVIENLNEQLEQIADVGPHLDREQRAVLVGVNTISDQFDREAKLSKAEDEVKAYEEENTLLEREITRLRRQVKYLQEELEDSQTELNRISVVTFTNDEVKVEADLTEGLDQVEEFQDREDSMPNLRRTKR